MIYRRRIIKLLVRYLQLPHGVRCRSSRGKRLERDVPRVRSYGLREMDYESEATFRSMYRMERDSFEHLLRLIQPYIRVDHKFTNKRYGVISARTKLACTLRWLAGRQYLDIIRLFGISKTAFFSNKSRGVLWPSIKGLDQVFKIGFPIHDHDELNEIAKGFSEFSRGRMNHCVLAVDGWVCRTRAPYASETEFFTSYYNRHDCYGLVVLAGCDSKLRFRMFSACSSGSTNDCLAWDICSLNSSLDNGLLPEQFYFVGDEAFTCTKAFTFM